MTCYEQSNPFVFLVMLRHGASERRVIEAFLKAGATDFSSGMLFVPSEEGERRAMDRLARQGVINRNELGGYWLDPHALSVDRARQVWKAVGIVAGLILALLLLAWTLSN